MKVNYFCQVSTITAILPEVIVFLYCKKRKTNNNNNNNNIELNLLNIINCNRKN